MRRGLLVLALLAGAPAAVAQAPAPTLCATGEQVIFTCGTTRARIISLCATGPLSKTAGTLQYRYGTVERQVELVWPVPVAHPTGYFVSGTVTTSGGGGAYLKFNHDGDAYAVYTGIGRGWEKAGLLVTRSGRVIGSQPCEVPVVSEIGPELFERAGIGRDPRAFEFEIP